MLIRWFKTKRALIADLDRQRDLLAELDELIGSKRRQIRKQAQAISAQAARLASIYAEAEKLREDIRCAEQAQQPVGIMRPVDLAPAPKRRGGLGDRIHNQPVTWQQHDEIQQDAEADARENQ